MRALIAASLILALSLAGCASDDSTPTTDPTTTTTTTTEPVDHTPESFDVPIRGSAYVNGTLTIKTGDTINWVHEDGNTPHTVTADDGSFDSNPNCGTAGVGVPLSQVCMVSGNTYTRKFDTAGSFAYHCKIHSGMKATITVTEHM
jgi:plastocyanin